MLLTHSQVSLLLSANAISSITPGLFVHNTNKLWPDISLESCKARISIYSLTTNQAQGCCILNAVYQGLIREELTVTPAELMYI